MKENKIREPGAQLKFRGILKGEGKWNLVSGEGWRESTRIKSHLPQGGQEKLEGVHPQGNRILHINPQVRQNSMGTACLLLSALAQFKGRGWTPRGSTGISVCFFSDGLSCVVASGQLDSFHRSSGLQRDMSPRESQAETVLPLRLSFRKSHQKHFRFPACASFVLATPVRIRSTKPPR